MRLEHHPWLDMCWLTAAVIAQMHAASSSRLHEGDCTVAEDCSSWVIVAIAERRIVRGASLTRQ